MRMTGQVCAFIIDDDQIQNEIHSLLIEKSFPQVKVRTFTRCQEAIEAFAQGHAPDIIFLDLHMQGENIKLILDEHKTCQLPGHIYIMSSLPYMDDLSILHNYPAVKDFINKPLLKHKLSAVFDETG